MQVKNLDKFAKKLKKQYSDALSQNDDAIKEIAFIDGKLGYLKGKYKTLVENMTHRKSEYERLSKMLDQCVGEQDSLMNQCKGRVLNNNQVRAPPPPARRKPPLPFSPPPLIR